MCVHLILDKAFKSQTDRIKERGEKKKEKEKEERERRKEEERERKKRFPVHKLIAYSDSIHIMWTRVFHYTYCPVTRYMFGTSWLQFYTMHTFGA